MSAADHPANGMRIRYTDEQGETTLRRILPIDAPYLGSKGGLSEPEWLIRAIDVDAPEGGEGGRVFAMARMVVLPPSAAAQA